VTRGWHDWVFTFTGVALVTVAVLPLAALVAWALTWRRSVGGATSAWARRTSLAEVGILYGTVPFVWMTMLPGSRAGQVPGRVSLVPLLDVLIHASAPIAAGCRRDGPALARHSRATVTLNTWAHL
jgi:hypothetical protein